MDVLTGVPSIVFGLFIYIALIVGTGSSYAGYKGSFALSLLMLPVVIRSAEVILLLVPGALCSALALGAPRWKVISRIVVPTALPGMVTGILLAIARAAGETAPLLFTAASTKATSYDLGGFMNSLPVQIYGDVTSPTTSVVNRAWGAALDARPANPPAQPHRPPRLAKEPSCMTPDASSPPANVKDATVDPEARTEHEREPIAAHDRREPAAEGSADARGRRRDLPRAAGPQRPPRRPARLHGAAEQLKGIDLEFHANEVTAIIGPSGCGKSTMIRCINRMHEEIPGARAEGRVMLDHLDVYEPSVDVVAVRRAIGMVFQKPNPFPTMSMFDNVAAGLRLSGGLPALRKSLRRLGHLGGDCRRVDLDRPRAELRDQRAATQSAIAFVAVAAYVAALAATRRPREGRGPSLESVT